MNRKEFIKNSLLGILVIPQLKFETSVTINWFLEQKFIVNASASGDVVTYSQHKLYHDFSFTITKGNPDIHITTYTPEKFFVFPVAHNLEEVKAFYLFHEKERMKFNKEFKAKYEKNNRR